MENANARQIASMSAKLDHISQVMEELRSLPATLAAMQRDQQHIAEWQRQVNAMSESRGIMMHAMDKRITVLERWHRFFLTMPAVALTVILALAGYVRGYIQSTGQFEDEVLHRITKIEANIQHYAVTPPIQHPNIEGKK